jgi:hypothetical protein
MNSVTNMQFSLSSDRAFRLLERAAKDQTADNAGYRWLGRPAVTLKVCRGDRRGAYRRRIGFM